MGKTILKLFSVLIALLGIFLFIIKYEVMGIVAVVLAIIIFPSERRGVKQQSCNDYGHGYNIDHDIKSGESSSDNDSGSGSEGKDD